MAESELPHDEKAFFDALAGIDCAGISGHDLGYSSGSWGTADRNDAVHNVALGKDSGQASIPHHGNGTDTVLHHVTRGFQNRPVRIDAVELPVFYEIAKSGHDDSLGSGAS